MVVTALQYDCAMQNNGDAAADGRCGSRPAPATSRPTPTAGRTDRSGPRPAPASTPVRWLSCAPTRWRAARAGTSKPVRPLLLVHVDLSQLHLSLIHI